MRGFPAADLLPRRSVARALLDGRLPGLCEHDPARGEALLASAAAAATRSLDRAGLAAALSAGLSELDAPAAARAAARELGEEGTVAVVAGQQPGLLGGSTMVLVKALAAAALCRRLREAGRPAVPVFWLASEDHDHAEADHVAILRDGAPVTLRVPLPGDRRMLSRVPVPEELGPLVAETLRVLAPGAGGDVLAAVLPPRAGESYGTAVGRLLARVLGVHGIVVVEPHRLRALAARVVVTDAEHPGRLRGIVEDTLARIGEAGCERPVNLVRDALWFRVDEEGRRAPPGAGERPPADGSGVSWNVVSRVLAQDLALPVAAQVCGPAEMSYVSLLRGAHEALGLPQPAALLRPGVTIVTPPARRAAAALGIEPAEVVRRGAVEPAGGRLDAGDAGEVAALEGVLAALPAGRSPATARRLRALRRDAALYAAALAREARERDDVRTRRTALLESTLLPLGGPQERSLSFLPWYAAGGDAVVARLLDLLGSGEPVHHVLRTEDL